MTSTSTRRRPARARWAVCLASGIYAAQVPGPVDVDLLSTAPREFAVYGNGTADTALSWQLWLTDDSVGVDDVNSANFTPIVQLEGIATSAAGQSVSFGAIVTINAVNRAKGSSDPSQPGNDPLCKARIVQIGGIALPLLLRRDAFPHRRPARVVHAAIAVRGLLAGAAPAHHGPQLQSRLVGVHEPGELRSRARDSAAGLADLRRQRATVLHARGRRGRATPDRAASTRSPAPRDLRPDVLHPEQQLPDGRRSRRDCGARSLHRNHLGRAVLRQLRANHQSERDEAPEGLRGAGSHPARIESTDFSGVAPCTRWVSRSPR